MDTKASICLIYFKNVTEYFTALTGQDDSRIEKIAWSADREAEREGIPTLDRPLITRSIHAISAGQTKEMATKAEACCRWLGCGDGPLEGSLKPYQHRVHMN